MTIQKVYVHADGGTWIQALYDWLPNVQFVMDGFHLVKRLQKISRSKGAAPYMGVIRQSMRKDQLSNFMAYCARIYEKLDERGVKPWGTMYTSFKIIGMQLLTNAKRSVRKLHEAAY